MPIIFCLLILFCIWLTYERKKRSRMEEEARNTFLKTEKTASIARKKDISNLEYITIPMECLPIQKGTEDAINDCIDQLLTISQTPIVNLSNFTNTELKLQYGTANFELLCEYEENYHSLIHLLADWGYSLYEQGKRKQARTVLEYAISIGSDLRRSFFTLAKLYAEEENEACIKNLHSHIQEHHPEHAGALLLELENFRFHQYLT